MKNLKLIMSILTMLGVQTMSGQTFEDLLRYSQKNYQATARSMGVGNAMGAVGADPSSMSINPAGLGLYRKNEFTFGMAIADLTSNSTYLSPNNTDNAEKFNLNVGNVGLVISDLKYDQNLPKKDGWVAVNYGVTFNRTNSFNSKISINGGNGRNSIVDAWAQMAAGQSPGKWQASPFSYQNLAIQSQLLIPNADSTNTKYRPFGGSGHNVYQNDQIAYSGSMNDICLSVGANYSNKLFIGATISIPTISYHYSRTYTENHQKATDSITNVTLNETVNTSGVGISAIVGIIYKPTDYFRFGASIHLPELYSMSDDYTTSITSTISVPSPNTLTEPSPQGSFDYSIVTPARYTASAAFLFGKFGFASADLEYVNYPGALMNTSYSGDSIVSKKVMLHSLQGGLNLRLGIELKYELIAFRVGVSFSNTPYNYKSPDNPTPTQTGPQIVSFGIGYRAPHSGFFADLGFQFYTQQYGYYPYTTGDYSFPRAIVNDYRMNGLLTVGVRF